MANAAAAPRAAPGPLALGAAAVTSALRAAAYAPRRLRRMLLSRSGRNTVNTPINGRNEQTL